MYSSLKFAVAYSYTGEVFGISTSSIRFYVQMILDGVCQKNFLVLDVQPNFNFDNK